MEDLDDLFGGDLEEPTEARPDSDTPGTEALELPAELLVDKPKKTEMVRHLGQLVQNGELHEDEFNELRGQKVDELRARFKARFLPADSVTGPATTGVDPNDSIDQVVSMVENLTEARAAEVLHSITDKTERSRFEIGGVLARMQAEGWTGDYEDFFSFATAEFGHARREILKMIQVYRCLTTCGCTWSEAKTLGWSKLARVAPILTPENYIEVFESVADLSFESVEEWVKAYRRREEDGDNPEGEGNEPSEVTRWTAKLYDDDMREMVEMACEKVKEESGTEDKGHQLYRICTDFMAGGAQPEGVFNLAQVSKSPEALSRHLHDLMTQALAAKTGKALEDFEDAALTVLGDAVTGDVEHWPEGMPEQAENEFLAALREEVRDVAGALGAVEERLELVGGEPEPEPDPEGEDTDPAF
jgi:hypothetical protein